MKHYTYADADGYVQFTSAVPDGTAPDTVDGLARRRLSETVSPSPGRGYRLRADTLTWEDARNLKDVKDEKWDDVKKARNKTEEGGFTWSGSVFDSDKESQFLIALANGGPARVWTLKDNTTRALTKAELVLLARALDDHIAAQRDKAAALRVQIKAATTKAEVTAITW